LALAQEDLKGQLALAAAEHPDFPEDRFDGQGIVICAGGPRLFTCAWVAIGILRRHLGCTLPIEVWYLGAKEMGPPMQGLLELLGAEPVDALEVAKRHQVDRLGGWELKAYALAHSRFREVLLLDADNVPVREPSFLFERPEFRESGALFWPDIVKLSAVNPIWAISGIDYRDMWSLESGQMVLDKSRCWRALCLTHWINQRSDDFYRFLHGDKDTFLIAWLKLAQTYYLIPHRPKLLDFTLCQRDPDGELLFQHRNSAKWILHGDNPKIGGFRLEDECRALLNELADLWDGRVFAPPPRSQEVRGLEGELLRIREFLFIRVSSDERRIELLPGHRIGAGGDDRERYWYVADGVEGPELRLEGSGLQSCALRCSEDGRWRGRLLQKPYMPVELVPVSGGDLTENQTFIGKRETLLSLLDRMLQSGAQLPWDHEVARDLLGTMRTFAALDPAVIEWLKEEEKRLAPTSARARIVSSALGELTGSAQRPERGEVAPGHDWLKGPQKLNWDEGYER